LAYALANLSKQTTRLIKKKKLTNDYARVSLKRKADKI
jgi:hypothetical protein